MPAAGTPIAPAGSLSRALRSRWLFAVATLVALVPALPFAAVVPEARLKAAFVSKFPQFVTWPPEVLDGRRSIDLCVASPNPFGDDLATLVEGETVAGRTLNVRLVDTLAELRGCHLLFVRSSIRGVVHPLLAAAEAFPILTVGDDEDFLDRGGIVGLHVIGGRVRFEVDDDAARRVGLRISSQLLTLAMSVRGGPR